MWLKVPDFDLFKSCLDESFGYLQLGLCGDKHLFVLKSVSKCHIPNFHFLR